jgi:DNA repair ATPase RecN
MEASRWWKCDLQVATPSWDFKIPPGHNFDFSQPDGRAAFLDLYMEQLKAKKIEVIALADHNSSEWIDDVVAAGKRHSIVVFPGCEVTTHTGADGVHLIVIGDTTKTGKDFDRLIHGALGFDAHEHTPFREQGGARLPGVSSKSVIQILDDLPDGYLVVAPHVLGDNGIVSGKTVHGDIRWKSLHHPRLSALDPGDCSNAEEKGFNGSFRGRKLANFPRLKSIAFVATSDAYELDRLGARFCWIRMGTPSIEALRQAFLDHESRILCDWSKSLAAFPERNPNLTRHGWVKEIELGGELGNSKASLSLPLHHGLNVIIGGRGSGKSTIVSAIRQLFSSNESLPGRLRDEATAFVDAVFSKAVLHGNYALPQSQEVLTAAWSAKTGSVTEVRGEALKTDFPVTVISQKELFERASGDKEDPFLPSRSLLALLDEHVGLGAAESEKVGSWHRRTEDARSEWGQATRVFLELTKDVGQLKQLREQITTVQTQVNAFAAPEVKARLARIDARRTEAAALREMEARFKALVEDVQATMVDGAQQPERAVPDTLGGFAPTYTELWSSLESIEEKLVHSVHEAVQVALTEKEGWDVASTDSAWWKDVLLAETDLKTYTGELQAKGLSPSEFDKLQEKLKSTRETVKSLEAKEAILPAAKQRVAEATEQLKKLFEERRARRTAVLDEIQQRSGRLKFTIAPFADTTRWQESMRSLCGFRVDSFQSDVIDLAESLWTQDQALRDERWSRWRVALALGNFSKWQEENKLRAAFMQRLAALDETIRHRLATEVPDDVVTMHFLRDDGKPENAMDWQPITEGSPGQRTAAMLAFVLHHGNEPLVLDQPEDDLDSEWISKLVVRELRDSRWRRQLIVVSHNANIPVLGDADQVITLENRSGALAVRTSHSKSTGSVPHVGPVEYDFVRNDIQNIMEGGVTAFIQREQKYHCETSALKAESGGA